MSRTIQSVGNRRLYAVGLAFLVALAALATPALTRSAGANGGNESGSSTPAGAGSGQLLTELTVEGVGTRSVNHDGAVGRFTVSVLRDSLKAAVSDGNKAVDAIAREVEKQCTEGEPEDADHTAPPTCISPTGLTTVGIRINEEYDWTEQGRISQGFRYQNELAIAIRGTGFAGGLVDLVIGAGGDSVRFEGLNFTVSRRAEYERLALLDAIDDARATARAIADHMGYEIVRIARMSPAGVDLYGQPESLQAARAEADDSESAPTPVFGGVESVTSRINMVFELRPAG